MNPRIGWGQPPTGWAQPQMPGWAPLVDPGPAPLHAARSVRRWLWPTVAVTGFLAVTGFVLGHDDPSPGLSRRGLLTIALAAVVIVLLTIHRTAGPGPLARATAEYSVVALLAALLALTGSGDQPPTNPASPAATTEATQADSDKPNAEAGQDRRPGVLRVAAGVARAVTGAIRAITGAAGWVADLWRQANATTDHPNHSPTTTAPKAEAMSVSPALRSSTRRPL